MTVEEAKEFVATQLLRLERKNRDGVLQPWDADHCADANEWWGLIQQRIALSHPHPQRVRCCAGLNLERGERTEAQTRAAEANGRRLAASRAA